MDQVIEILSKTHHGAKFHRLYDFKIVTIQLQDVCFTACILATGLLWSIIAVLGFRATPTFSTCFLPSSSTSKTSDPSPNFPTSQGSRRFTLSFECVRKKPFLCFCTALRCVHLASAENAFFCFFFFIGSSRFFSGFCFLFLAPHGSFFFVSFSRFLWILTIRMSTQLLVDMCFNEATLR